MSIGREAPETWFNPPYQSPQENSILVSSGCPNKMPHTEMRGISFLTGLEAESRDPGFGIPLKSS